MMKIAILIRPYFSQYTFIILILFHLSNTSDVTQSKNAYSRVYFQEYFVLILVIFCQYIFVNIFNNVWSHFALLPTRMKTQDCFPIRISLGKEYFTSVRITNIYLHEILSFCVEYFEKESVISKFQMATVRSQKAFSIFFFLFFSMSLKDKVNLEFLLTIKEHKY